MKRKFLVTAAVCALSAVCIFGATACKGGDESDNNGSHVPDVGASIRVSSEEEWNAAFEKTNTCRNYTQSTYMVVKGRLYNEYDHTYFNYNETHRWTSYIVGNEMYWQSSSSGNYVNGTTISTTQKTYQIKEENIEYIAIWDDEQNEWEVHLDSEHPDTGFGLKDTPDFSSFEFENGKYVGNIVVDEIEVTATVKINAEGYVSYINLKGEEGDASIFQENAFYNFGSTTYTMPEDAKKAVEDYKAANG